MRTLSFLLLFLLIHVDKTYAYIDPNTGGFFFQTVAPFVYAILGAIVIFWKRISMFFKGLFGRNKEKISSSDNE